MSKAGWYPDPGGQPNMFRYWDGKAWSSATSPNPSAAPPSQGIGSTPAGPVSTAAGQQPYGGQGYSQYGAGNSAYTNFQQTQKKKSSAGWWIGGIALIVVLVVVGVFAIRGLANGGNPIGGTPGGNPSENACPPEQTESQAPPNHPNDGRVHGGPVSYPMLGSPWGAPTGDSRVPFGVDVAAQSVTVEQNYQPNSSWVASVLVGELAAGDGFFTPEQGAGIVVRCILGKFYGDNPVDRDDKKNQAIQVDGHDAWLVESHLTFDIEGLKTKGELLIVVIVSAGATAGLYYASIPDTTPELVQPARNALSQLKVDS